jgi:hypothetical protein
MEATDIGSREWAVMASIEQLKAWFERDLRFATWGENAFVENLDPNKVEIRLYTDTNEYTLTLVTESADDSPLIDATVRSRKPRAGETALRMRRLLAPGRNHLTERVWRRVLGSIVGLELVRVHRREAPERVDESDEEPVTRRVRAGTE